MSDFLAGAGVVIAAAASAAAILLPDRRARSTAMLLAIALFPVLILGDQWHSHQIVDLREHTARLLALLAIGAAAVLVLAYAFHRWPTLIPLAIVFALPFRIPLEAGGESANLLVPLYVVIAGAALATALRGWRPSRGSEGDAAAAGGADIGLPRRAGEPISATGPAARAACWLPRILGAFVVLYAIQSLYSDDFSKGLENICFFLVPFTVAYGLLREVEWDRRLLTWTLALVAAEAVLFVLIGSVEYVTRSLFWNPQVIRSDEFHTYFRVNSVFWDPNIYGRYLALVTVVVTAAMLWARTREAFWLLSGLILVLWVGLVPTFSQSSLIALLAGLAMLAAIRWSWRWTLAAVAVGLVGAVLVVVLVGGAKKLSLDRIGRVDLSGRGNLVSGGIDLFGERPIWGYGSGSFQQAYRDHRAGKKAPVTISHTEPVTIAAEQGLVGLVFYVALIVVALIAMGAGLWRRGPPETSLAARAAVLAAFVALLVHTLAYAGFLEDPITWVLLALGASLAPANLVAPSAPVASPAAVRDAA